MQVYRIDDKVVVSDPKHKDSIHDHEFVGTIVSTPQFGRFYEVRDQNDDVFSVSADEILCLESTEQD